MINLPKCKCSVCGKELEVTGRQENSEGGMPRLVLSAMACECKHPDSVPCYDFGEMGETE